MSSTKEKKASQWECRVCLYVYDEEKGIPEEGVPPGTRWNDLPESWICPDCGVGKIKFVKI